MAWRAAPPNWTPTIHRTVKLLGNVPVSGKAPGGLLRHKGWKAEKIDLPPLSPGSNASMIAPAEVEVE